MTRKTSNPVGATKELRKVLKNWLSKRDTQLVFALYHLLEGPLTKCGESNDCEHSVRVLGNCKLLLRNSGLCLSCRTRKILAYASIVHDLAKTEDPEWGKAIHAASEGYPDCQEHGEIVAAYIQRSWKRLHLSEASAHAVCFIVSMHSPRGCIHSRFKSAIPDARLIELIKAGVLFWLADVADVTPARVKSKLILEGRFLTAKSKGRIRLSLAGFDRTNILVKTDNGLLTRTEQVALSMLNTELFPNGQILVGMGLPWRFVLSGSVPKISDIPGLFTLSASPSCILIRGETVHDTYQKITRAFSSLRARDRVPVVVTHVERANLLGELKPVSTQYSLKQLDSYAKRWLAVTEDAAAYFDYTFTHGERIYNTKLRDDKGQIGHFSQLEGLRTRAQQPGGKQDDKLVVAIYNPIEDNPASPLHSEIAEKQHMPDIPASLSICFYVKYGKLSCTAFYRTQELSTWWIVNAIELQILLRRVQDQAFKNTVGLGSMTMVTNIAIFDPKAKLFTAPSIARQTHHEREVLGKKLAGGEQKARETMLGYLDEIIEGAFRRHLPKPWTQILQGVREHAGEQNTLYALLTELIESIRKVDFTLQRSETTKEYKQMIKVARALKRNYENGMD